MVAVPVIEFLFYFILLLTQDIHLLQALIAIKPPFSFYHYEHFLS